MAKYYYRVWVASGRYHSRELLTYSHDRPLNAGAIVAVQVKQWESMAIVDSSVAKPVFNTKPILWSAYSNVIPRPSVELRRWFDVYYPGSSGITTQLFLPVGRLQSSDFDSNNDNLPQSKPTVEHLPKLKNDQSSVVKSITSSGSYLLHGKTGSGKTRVYQELALKSFNKGRSVIILTPEISMTAQLYKNFEAIFKEHTILVHSHLKPSERRKNWVRMLNSRDPVVIIGTRSALFGPLPKVGLIVIDEAHEPAYKQDSTPYYQTNRVASKLRGLHDAILVFGTATPLVSDYFIAQQKHIPILSLDKPAVTKHGTKVEPVIVDLKDRSHFRKARHISDELFKSIQQALSNQEQALLFLNRRGTAHVVLCQNCGWQAMCPHCDVPLTYHGDDHKMRCHSCNFSQPSITSCPNCHSNDIVFRSIGTKAINDEIKRLFPGANVMRFDTDNKKSERFEENYETIINGKVDIIIGTQTLAKGLDLPKLSVVGVITADTGLYIPDFMAQERTYQLVSQVIGRTSRGKNYGQAVIQTYNPSSPVLKAAIKDGWQDFYNKEIEERQKYVFPPFCYILKLSCRRSSAASSKSTALELANNLKRQNLKIIIDGPAPSFHEKHGSKFEWQLIIKTKNRSELIKIIGLLPAGWSYDIDPTNLL